MRNRTHTWLHRPPTAKTAEPRFAVPNSVLSRQAVFHLEVLHRALIANETPAPRGHDFASINLLPPLRPTSHHQNRPQQLIQRFEAPEHQDLGDSALANLNDFIKTDEGAEWATQNDLDLEALSDLSVDPMLNGHKIKAGKKKSVLLTTGDIIALHGDFYRNPTALMAAPDEELRMLLKAMKQERTGELSNARANEEYQKTTLRFRKQKDSFVELASEGTSHFAPENLQVWTNLHMEAINLASQATTEEERDFAIAYDASAGHFLTDAFAAGHLFDAKRLETEITAYLAQNPARPANPELIPIYGLINSKGKMHKLVLKNVHDRLNTEGAEVSNKKGMTWRTYGDNHIKNSQETQRIGALAVYMSRRQVLQAQDSAATSPDTGDVLDLLPDDASIERITEQAISYIPEAVDTLPGLIYRLRNSARTELELLVGPVVAKPIMAWFKTSANPGRKKQLEETQDRAQQTGEPQVAPQFTIVEF